MSETEQRQRLEITLSALGEDRGDVRLPDFQLNISALLKFLVGVDENINGRATLEWVVVDLHHSIPSVVIESRAGQRADVILSAGLEALSELGAGRDPLGLDDESLDVVREWIKPLGQTMRETQLKANGREVVMDVEFRSRFQKINFS